MATHQNVQRDERTVSVENTSYRWACNFLVFALLIDVMCRAVVRNEGAWDLMALAVLPGTVSLIYQVRQKTLPQGWVWKLMPYAFIAAVIAAAAAAILAMTRAM
jgi:hypothetical protein